jgi:hypothetical protein
VLAVEDERATRERLVLALIPTCSRHEMRKPQEIVDIATELCKYIVSPEVTVSTEAKGTGTTSLTQRSPKK